MDHENLETIIQNLRNWKDLCDSKDAERMTGILNQGIGFYFFVPGEHHVFTRGSEQMTSSEEPSFYHIYPGLSREGTLHYYLIHALHDTEKQFEKGIRPYIIECKLTNDYQGFDNRIEDKEAKRLIGNWQEYRKDWIAFQTRSETGMYLAFTVPDSDIPEGMDLKCFFALKETTSPEGVSRFLDLSADLVFSDLQDQVIVRGEAFSDLARPVPPFKSGIEARENFFLLSLVEVDEYL